MARCAVGAMANVQCRMSLTNFRSWNRPKPPPGYELPYPHGLSPAEALRPSTRLWSKRGTPRCSRTPLAQVPEAISGTVNRVAAAVSRSVNYLGNLVDCINDNCGGRLIVVTVGFVQEYRSEKSIEALNHLCPEPCAPRTEQPGCEISDEDRVRRTGPVVREEQPDLTGSGAATPSRRRAEATSSEVAAAQLVPGDLVLFTTGDRIPADIRVTKASDLTIDASNLTGENEPVGAVAEPRSRGGLTLPRPWSRGSCSCLVHRLRPG